MVERPGPNSHDGKESRGRRSRIINRWSQKTVPGFANDRFIATSGISRRSGSPVLRQCGRAGQYRKQNLIEHYGGDIRLPDLREEIAKCSRHGQMHERVHGALRRFSAG